MVLKISAVEVNEKINHMKYSEVQRKKAYHSKNTNPTIMVWTGRAGKANENTTVWIERLPVPSVSLSRSLSLSEVLIIDSHCIMDSNVVNVEDNLKVAVIKYMCLFVFFPCNLFMPMKTVTTMISRHFGPTTTSSPSDFGP